MGYKLAVFDMDGTILNTLEDLADAANYVLRRYGFPERSLQEVRSYLGNGIAALVKCAAPKETEEAVLKKMLADFLPYYGEHCEDKTKPYEGITELIQKLRSEGYLTAVVSNKADFAVQQLCEKYFPDCFDCAIGEREGARKKPAPDSVYAVLEELKVTKKDAVYIGDSEVDLKTARNSGLDEIIVTWGFREEEQMRALGARRIARTPGEVYEIIKEH